MKTLKKIFYSVIICSLPTTLTNLTGLLSVGAAGDVEEDFEDLYDPLRGLQRDGRHSRAQHTLELLLPLDLQAALHGRRQNRHASLLVKWRRPGEKTTGVKLVRVKTLAPSPGCLTLCNVFFLRSPVSAAP